MLMMMGAPRAAQVAFSFGFDYSSLRMSHKVRKSARPQRGKCRSFEKGLLLLSVPVNCRNHLPVFPLLLLHLLIVLFSENVALILALALRIRRAGTVSAGGRGFTAGLFFDSRGGGGDEGDRRRMLRRDSKGRRRHSR
jgi:hypothetical protein